MCIRDSENAAFGAFVPCEADGYAKPDEEYLDAMLTVYYRAYPVSYTHLNDRPRQQHTAERDKAHLLLLGKGGTVLSVAAQVLHLTGSGIQRAACKPDFVRRVHKQHFWAAHGTRRGLPQQGLQHIGGNGGVVVQQQHIVAAIGQCTAHTHIVDGGKAQVLLLRQKHRVGRQFILQLRYQMCIRDRPARPKA